MSAISLLGLLAAIGGPAVPGITALAVPAASAQRLDAAARAKAIDGVLARIREHYVFPDVAEKMAQAVRQKAARKEYDALDDGQALAERLTRDLQTVSKDKHVRVSYSPTVLPPPQPSIEKPSDQDIALMRRMLERINFGVPKVEVMPGNIGYVRIDLLAPPEFAGDTYAAAMNTVAHTSALILDLRNCGGAISPHAIPMLTGYFFREPVHLIDLKWNHSDYPRQSWSAPYVPGKRYLDKPVYVLTSERTFSGAEELAYDLQNLKRATVVGAVTGGGANPGGDHRADDHFRVFVPSGQVTSPITRTNWEGVGVKPDVETPAEQALREAHRIALEKAIAASRDEEEKAWLGDALRGIGR